MKRLTIRQCAEAGIEFAPEKPAIQEKEKIEFTTRFVDEGYEKAVMEKVGAASEGFDMYENREEKVWFEADAGGVGTERKGRIKAETSLHIRRKIHLHLRCWNGWICLKSAIRTVRLIRR